MKTMLVAVVRIAQYVSVEGLTLNGTLVGRPVNRLHLQITVHECPFLRFVNERNDLLLSLESREGPFVSSER